MAGTEVIRCPVCLSAQSIAKQTPPEKRIYCGNCRHDFQYRNGLALSNADQASTTTTANNLTGKATTAQATGSPVVIWLAGLLLAGMALLLVRSHIQPMRGPDFLVFYVLLFIGIWIGVVVLRKMTNDNQHITLLGLALFELVGVVRFIDGTAAGMHKFGAMFIIMIIGGVLLFIRSDHFNNSGNGSCSSCSGCGGGCGGCGGCG